MSRAWMPMYWADYKSDTAHLSRDEHGGYMLLIAHYWHTGSLPDDDERLARITLCQSQCEWHALRSAIKPFFEDGWKHKRIDAELAKAEEAYKKRALASEKAHAARWGKNANGNANRMPMACQSQSQSQSHISSNEDINITSTSKASDGCAVASPSKRFDDQLLRSTAEAWNELATSVGLATVAKLTDARKVAITRRAKELVDDFDYPDPQSGFSDLFSKIRGSPFLRGSESSWRCDFDWCFALSNFTKIMEGKYENRPQKVVSFRR